MTRRKLLGIIGSFPLIGFLAAMLKGDEAPMSLSEFQRRVIQQAISRGLFARIFKCNGSPSQRDGVVSCGIYKPIDSHKWELGAFIGWEKNGAFDGFALKKEFDTKHDAERAMTMRTICEVIDKAEQYKKDNA